jgi:hypothetical protein
VTWTDDKLGELLASLPPVPQDLVERAKRLPAHSPEGPPERAEDESGDSGDHIADDAAPAGAEELGTTVEPHEPNDGFGESLD